MIYTKDNRAYNYKYIISFAVLGLPSDDQVSVSINKV